MKEIIFLIMAAFVAAHGEKIMDASEINNEIYTMNSHIIENGRADVRASHMRELVKFLSSLNQQQVAMLDEQALDDIAGLLNIDGESGRFYGGRALGVVACRAKRYLPALRDALGKAQPIRSSFGDLILTPQMSAYAEISSAIGRIEQIEPC